MYLVWYTLNVGKKRRGGYIFVDYIGDHWPPHVHVYDSKGLVCKWDIENWQPMKGGRVVPRVVKKYLKELYGGKKDENSKN